MTRPTAIKLFALVLGVLALLAYLPLFNSVRITAPMIGIPLVITRYGEEIPPDQICSVQCLIDVNLNKPPHEIRSASLRDATRNQSYYMIGTNFTVYRTGWIFQSTEVKPQFRSMSLRITFIDGRMISLSCPIISDNHENMPLYVDLSEVPR